MKTSECYYLGRINKPWGVKGQLSLFLDVDSPEEYLGLDSAYIDIKGQLIPHFFHIDSLNGNKAVATFEDIGPDQASALAGRDMYLPLDMLPKLDGNRFYFHEITGFRVVDRERGDIGHVEQVLEYPAQPLLQVMRNNVEILIPIIDEVIKDVDRENKTLLIEAPKGLIDLYLDDTNSAC